MGSYAIYDKVMEEFRAKGLSREEALSWMECESQEEDVILREYRGEWYFYADGTPIRINPIEGRV